MHFQFLTISSLLQWFISMWRKEKFPLKKIIFFVSIKIIVWEVFNTWKSSEIITCVNMKQTLLLESYYPLPPPFFDYFTQNTHQNYVNIKVFWMIIEKIINKKKNPYTSAFYCLRIWIPDPDSHYLNLFNKTHGWCRRQNWGLTCITAFVVESGIAWYPLL